MAERLVERAPSISSSVTEAEAYDDHEKGSPLLSALKTPDELEIGDDVERAELLPQENEKAQPPKPDPSMKSAGIWMVVNTLATIGIVSSCRFVHLQMQS
jgi:solute carrier family 35 protein E3